jgi:tetratricopeptide (TPR) repeat protein
MRTSHQEAMGISTHSKRAIVRSVSSGGLAFMLLLACTMAGTLVTGCHDVAEWQAERHVDRGQAYLQQDDLEAALLEFQEAAKLDPQLAVAHSQMGVIYRRMGEYEQAIEAFVSAIRLDPFDFEGTLNLAQLYHFTQRIKDAIQAYLHAIRLQPDHFEAQLNLGVCYQQLGLREPGRGAGFAGKILRGRPCV